MASQRNLGVKFYKISRKNCSDDYSRSKMDDVKRQITSLRNQARESGKVQTTNVTINGRKCTVEAKVVGFWIFKTTEITVKYTLLGSKHNIVSKFVCFMERGIDRKILNAETKIEQIEKKIGRVAPLIETLKEIAGQKITIADFPSHMPQINKALANIRSFVQQNNLFPCEIASLRQSLRDLCNKPIIQFEENEKSLFSINESNCDPHCLEIALEAEAIEILLDAQESGQVGLEKNAPPDIKDLGSGRFNTVKLAHTGKDGQNPVALKPCDQSKSEATADAFARTTRGAQAMIGRVSGSYRRNKATAKLQDMLVNIGRGVGITVPHVVATVSAATMEGIPCIAMEALKGGTLRHAANCNEIEYDNEFVRRETWIQLQDILTGQIDRHGNNVILTKDGPVAIDHDLSFPTDPPRKFAATVPTNIAVAQRWRGKLVGRAVDNKSRRNYCMPPVIDEEMYKVIMAIKSDELENMYEECGLTRPEIQAAMSRVEALKKAAQELMEQNRVIAQNEWAASCRVRDHCNTRNFYATRHSYRKQ
jgi:hypothetical protein